MSSAQRGKFYKNLNRDRWSFYPTSTPPVQHCKQAELSGVTCKQPTSQAFWDCHLNSKPRNVFCWMVARTWAVDEPFKIPPEAQRIRFNPHRDKFFNVNGVRVDRLEKVWLTSTGECWGVL